MFPLVIRRHIRTRKTHRATHKTALTSYSSDGSHVLGEGSPSGSFSVNRYASVKPDKRTVKCRGFRSVHVTYVGSPMTMARGLRAHGGGSALRRLTSVDLECSTRACQRTGSTRVSSKSDQRSPCEPWSAKSPSPSPYACAVVGVG